MLLRLWFNWFLLLSPLLAHLNQAATNSENQFLNQLISDFPSSVKTVNCWGKGFLPDAADDGNLLRYAVLWYCIYMTMLICSQLREISLIGRVWQEWKMSLKGRPEICEAIVGNQAHYCFIETFESDLCQPVIYESIVMKLFSWQSLLIIILCRNFNQKCFLNFDNI